MSAKITARQLQVLRAIATGAEVNLTAYTTQSLVRKGLIHRHPVEGWMVSNRGARVLGMFWKCVD